MGLTQVPPRTGSLRSRAAAAVTHAFVKPLNDRNPGTDVGVAISRQVVARSMAAFGPALADTEITKVHGSAYALCSPRTHRGLVSRLSAVTGLPAFCLEYRLAPRHPFPAAADDAAAASDWLVKNRPAQRILPAGDSAGGHLAVDLCLSLVRAGRSLPAAQLLLSPVADVTMRLAAGREQVRPDPMISAAAAGRFVAQYTLGADLAHPRRAHLRNEGEVLPPTLIQAGGREMLAADAHHLHRALTATGTKCCSQVWPDQMHVFQALPRLVPEADLALAQASGGFLRAGLAEAAQCFVDERRTA